MLEKWVKNKSSVQKGRPMQRQPRMHSASILRQLGICGMVPGIEYGLGEQGLKESMCAEEMESHKNQ